MNSKLSPTSASIITIGDEILIGQTVDTNSAWIAAQLNLIGISVNEIISISDQKEKITEALNRELIKSQIIIVTGGLGPTNDDITKSVITNYFNDELELNEELLEKISAYFKSANRPMLEVNRLQAMLPKKAKLIENDLGTAAGMWFTKDNNHVISLPGVPYEMKGLMEKIIPQLKTKFQLADFYHRTILFQGIGESQLAENIKEVENETRKNGIQVAYLPSTGLVKIRLTGNLDQANLINKTLETFQKKYPQLVYGFEDTTLEEVIGELLKQNGKTLGTVESCSGGAIASRIVSISGASSYFMGSIVSYDYKLKTQIIGVSEEILSKYGAVSQETVELMAKNGRQKLGVDYCIAASGIAGPDGGTDDKPVGTIWIAIASKDEIQSKKFLFKQNRQRNIESTVVYALNFLRRFILKLQ